MNQVRTETIRLDVTGIHCGSCVSRVENILLAQPGVTRASVNLASQTALVTGTAREVSARTLSQVLTQAGYESQPKQAKLARRVNATNDTSASRTNLILAVALTIPVFVLEMGSHWLPDFAQWVETVIGTQLNRWIQMVLSAIVLFVAGREFFRIGVPALLRRAPEMNSLVAIGAFAAWLFSTATTLLPEQIWMGKDVYFESAAVIVTLILLGRFFEARAKGHTSQAISALADMQPDTATVKRGNQWLPAPIDSLAPGDVIQIKPGERIALDGVVVSGSSHVNESMLTGEPVPVLRAAGDPVTGGTLNTDGALVVEVRAVGSETVLAQIIERVEDAQGSKLPIQALVDKVAMWFVPAVLIIAALTFVVWFFVGSEPNRFGTALIHAVSVLIIACPCAMGLATPMSVMTGIGRAARVGILFRNGQALQQLGQTDLIAFDKTGTLTVGKPTLTDIKALDGFDESKLLSAVASLQAKSEHPIATAVVDAARQRNLPLLPATDFTATAGFGVSAMIDNQRVSAGNHLFLAQQGIDTNPLRPAIDAANTEQTVFLIGIDNRAAGVMIMADSLRKQAAPTLAALRAMGIELAVISGDRTQTVSSVAKALDIEHALGEVLPEQKQERVEQLRAGNKRVAFVGDGINDAPALAQADVGIAIGSGTDVAIESADLVLAGDDLSAVTRGVRLSRATVRNIKQNLFWAFIYNLILIPVAAGLLVPVMGISLSPMLAAGAMSLSSIFVVLNALRLNHINID